MRIDRDTFHEITEALVRNRSRSLLTGFGIFWGVFMLLFLMGGGSGFKNMMRKNFEGFATNTMIVIADNTAKPYAGFRKGRSWNLVYSDVERLKAMVPELETVTPTIARWGQTAVRETYTTSASVKGLYPDYANIETPRIMYGRYLNDTDIQQERKVCVIGKKIYNTLFPEGGDPCGQRIRVGSVYYQIVGVDINSGNISINGSAEESIIIPLPLAQKLYRTGNKVDLICMTGHSGISMSAIEDRVRTTIARIHKIDPTDKRGIYMINTEEMFSLMDNLFHGLDFLILLVGLGTILAGAIGVSNIMMVTVKERTTEIGIRRAIGATPNDILSQIIMESISLTMLSGCSGIVFSVLLLGIMEKVTGEPGFQISFWTAVITALLLTVVGVLAGLAPASRAMNIKPVDAMRDE